MTKSEYQQYLSSERWRELRLQAIKRDGEKCQNCDIPRWLAEVAYDQDLNVHHVSYANLGTTGELDDLVTLCRRCHEIEKFGRSSLKPPHSTICAVCSRVHFNGYSDYCDFCRELIVERQGFLSAYLYEQLPDGRMLGEAIAVNLTQYFTADWLISMIQTIDRICENDKASGRWIAPRYHEREQIERYFSGEIQ